MSPEVVGRTIHLLKGLIMAEHISNLGCETLRRLCREGRVAEAGQFLREQFASMSREPEFSDAFLSAFIPNLVRVAELDLYAHAEAISSAWMVAEAYKLYPEDPLLGRLKRLILPAVDWHRGLDAAATLAVRYPSLPFASEYWARDAALKASRGSKGATSGDGAVVRLERRIAVTDYQLGRWESSGANAGAGRRTLLRSPQEREFMKAARAYFVGREVLPNVRLSNFIDVDQLGGSLPSDFRRYARLAEADVLIATPVDFDPIGVIELDSAYHDTPMAKLRDAMKGRLFEMAGIPLVRLRAEPVEAVSADTLYELLQNQWQKFEAFKPQGWREREGYTRLCPVA